ncbi:nuclear pore complex protein Nup50-like [Branchiostoma lanceolatum]|uniref:nuclear pore complex protein Nup50-like n=1 Tax=Branchiostoma lanceolatum TaxID=7740 RepID=UPI00345279A4
MAAKRTATTELTDRNWDQEEEPEEAGTWNPASRSEMSKRRVKKAIRRGNATSELFHFPQGGTGAFAKFSGLSNKPASTVFSGLGSKPASTVFSGLGSKPASTVFSGLGSKPGVFSGLNAGAAKPLAVSNGNRTTPSVPFSGFGTGSSTPSPGVSERSPAGGPSSPGASERSPAGSPSSPRYSPQYCGQLRSLNLNLLQWLQKHVDNNPVCDLTPSFRDYERHLRDIEARFPPATGTGTTGTDSVTGGNGVPDQTASQSGNGQLSFKFSSPPQDKTDTSAVTTNSSAFGVTIGQSASSGVTIGQSTSSGVTIGQSSSPSGITIGHSSSFITGTSTAPTPFSFSASSGGTIFGGASTTFGGSAAFGGAAGKPALDSGFKFSTTDSSSSASSRFKFSFASKPSAPTSVSSDTKEEESYEPPKPEVKEVKEDGAFYTIRCKLFYQKDGTYKDKGVGNLHLKKTGDSKTQLVVRADTSLGNILLNILLFPSMPVSRQGKNNVALVCVPNPPLDEKSDPVATPMLIRVKTGEAADELCKQLSDNKGSS